MLRNLPGVGSIVLRDPTCSQSLRHLEASQAKHGPYGLLRQRRAGRRSYHTDEHIGGHWNIKIQLRMTHSLENNYTWCVLWRQVAFKTSGMIRDSKETIPKYQQLWRLVPLSEDNNRDNNQQACTCEQTQYIYIYRSF